MRHRCQRRWKHVTDTSRISGGRPWAASSVKVYWRKRRITKYGKRQVESMLAAQMCTFSCVLLPPFCGGRQSYVQRAAIGRVIEGIIVDDLGKSPRSDDGAHASGFLVRVLQLTELPRPCQASQGGSPPMFCLCILRRDLAALK